VSGGEGRVHRAGSTVFTRNLVGDLLAMPELADGTTIALMDIDAERLRASERFAIPLDEYQTNVNVQGLTDEA
jgi:alpha-galactosidase/6-phospho-beta-glucosidase family protein